MTSDEITVALNEADFIEAYRPAPQQRRIASLVLLLALALALFILALLVQYPGARLAFTESRLIIGLSGAVLLVTMLVVALLASASGLRRRAARSTLEDHPGMRDPVHYTFDPEHFAMRSTFVQAQYPWAQLWDWRETERVIIVMPTPRNFYVIPKRGVDPVIVERMRSYLGQARKRAASG